MNRLKIWKIGVLLLLMQMLFSCAFAAESTRNPLAIDMVIVIENSLRMNEARSTERKLDKEGLRFDAAAALIGMCDAKYSRATYFLFNNDLYVYSETGTGNVTGVTPNDIALFDISLPVHKPQRQTMMETLNGSKIRNGYGTKAGADIGKAFSAAVDVQLRDQSNGNRKVILLLTSGNNALSDASLKMARDAKEKAVQNGIDVYAVALTDTSSTQLLQELVTSPDNYQFVYSPEDLVDVYRNFFAGMIGSDPMESRSVKLDDEKSEIQLEIPNDSVAEVNIILPLKQVDDLVLTDPEGKTITRTEDNVMVSKSTNFISYKLIAPKSDTYHLSYTSANEQNVVVQYVFSYGVQVQAEANAAKINKHEPVTITAKYYVDGMATRDEKLYNIPATLTLRKGNRIISSSLMEHQADGYSLTFDQLDQYGSGEYTADIHFEGDGLKRDSAPVVFELVNNPPELISPAVTGDRYHTTINIPREADSYAPEKNGRSWDLTTFAKDANGDALSAEIVSNTSETDAALDGMKLTVQPRKDTATTGEVRVLIKDDDGGLGPELSFGIEIENYESRYDQYTARFDPVRGIEKNSTCDLTLRMYDVNGEEVRTDSQVPDEIIASVSEPGTQPRDVTMKKEGGHWTGSFRTGQRATEYEASAKIKVGQKTISAENAVISSGNKAPSLIAEAKDHQSWSLVINEPSDTETYKEQTRTWSLNSFVEDLNGDPITFEIDRNASTADVVASINPADQTLTIKNKLNTETDGDIVVRCQDNDGLAGPDLTFHVTVVSNEEKYKAYTAELKPDGHGKSRDITVTLSVFDERGMLLTGDTNLPARMDGTYTLGNTQTPLTFERGKDGKWTGVFTTMDQEAEYTISASVRVSQNVSIHAPDLKLNTVNTPPHVVKELNAEAGIPGTIFIEPFLIWNQATGDVVVPDLNAHFADKDGDSLKYSLNYSGEEGRVEAGIEGSTLTIRGLSETSKAVQFTVTAEDNEGQTAVSQPVSFSVKSLKKQGTIILILIAAALVALFILYQIVKPGFHGQTFDVSTRKNGGDPIPQGKSSTLKGKKATKLGNFTTAGAKMACGSDVSATILNKITLKPAYGNCVKVRTEEMGTATVKVGATRLTAKKQKTLSTDGTLSVENNGTEVLFRLNKVGTSVKNTRPASPASGGTTGSADSSKKAPSPQRTSRT